MNECTEPVQARRNPAAVAAQRAARADYGPFCDAIRRLKCLTETQALIAQFLAKATLLAGFRSLPFSSQSELTQVRLHAPPLAGWAKNDLSPTLKALAGFGIIKLDERNALEAGVPPVTVLLVIADVRQWAVPADGWRYAIEDEKVLLDALLACRQRHTALLPSLDEDADLHDARAVVARPAIGDAPERVDQATTRRAGGGGGSPSVGSTSACRGVGSAKDAPMVGARTESGASASCRSESRNTERPMKSGGVPNFGTAPVKQLTGTEQRTVQQLNGVRRRDDSSRLLAELEVEFTRAHGADEARAEMVNSGGCWRQVARRWPNEFEAQIGGLRAHLNDGGRVETKAWFYFQFYFRRAVGCSTWQEVAEKARNLFNNQ